MTSDSEINLVVSIPQHPTRCYRFNGERVSIGRGKNNHLTLDNEVVSKIHCEFIKDPNSPIWVFRDLGSTNGSSLNGEESGWDATIVNDGDEIVLGNVIKLHFVEVRQFQTPEIDEDFDPDVNPVAAAIARQSKDDMESTQLIKLKAKPKKR